MNTWDASGNEVTRIIEDILDQEVTPNISIPKDVNNRHYVKFLQDVKKEGLSIVEGTDITTQSYVELRKNEYPSLQDQQDMQFWDQENGTSTWRDAIETIKNKYPKSISATTTIGPLPEWVQKLVE